ncbi:PASTA domain-containing protein [Myxococcota bacterium]|nr:PASTA domain-containing protein [Myxococcota bacterium]MBU1533687.1 PASTA domain-containing protein [Myxococcota bacterium]
MSRASSTVAISIATSLITSSLMFLGLQFWLVPHLNKSNAPKVEKPVEVPKVVGLRPDDARIILKNNGLLITVYKTSPHKTVKEGLIHAQVPLPGSLLRPGSTVKVETSSGIPKIAVPLVVGKTLTDGQTILAGMGLTVAVTHREDAASKPGQILSQNPPPGKQVIKDSVVNLIVAKGNSMVEVPNLTKLRFKSKKQMTEELKKLNLELGKVHYTDSSDSSNGTIYSHKPKKGEKVAPGTKVDFVVQYSED